MYGCGISCLKLAFWLLFGQKQKGFKLFGRGQMCRNTYFGMLNLRWFKFGDHMNQSKDINMLMTMLNNFKSIMKQLSFMFYFYFRGFQHYIITFFPKVALDLAKACWNGGFKNRLVALIAIWSILFQTKHRLKIYYRH